MTVAAGVAQGVAGVGLWSLAEYVLHRGHARPSPARAPPPESTGRTTPTSTPHPDRRTWVGAAIVAGPWRSAGARLVGVGWMAAYVAYELTHRHMHTVSRRAGGRRRRRPPYHRWVPAHHLHRHVVDARSDYGVHVAAVGRGFRTYRGRAPTSRPGRTPTHRHAAR